VIREIALGAHIHSGFLDGLVRVSRGEVVVLIILGRGVVLCAFACMLLLLLLRMLMLLLYPCNDRIW
jgi:hypothetical protein